MANPIHPEKLQKAYEWLDKAIAREAAGGGAMVNRMLDQACKLELEAFGAPAAKAA